MLTIPHIKIEKIEGSMEMGFTGIQVVEVIPEPGMVGFACVAAFLMAWGKRCR